MDFLLGIYYRDNKAEVLEVGDKLLKYIQHAEEGALSPPGPAVQSVSLRAVRLYRESMVEGGCCCCCCIWTSPVGAKCRKNNVLSVGYIHFLITRSAFPKSASRGLDGR